MSRNNQLHERKYCSGRREVTVFRIFAGVRRSVCLSRSWIMSKRINISSNFFHHHHSIFSVRYQTGWRYSDGNPLSGPDQIGLVPADNWTRANHRFKFRAIGASSSGLRNSFATRTVGDWNQLPAVVVEQDSLYSCLQKSAWQASACRMSHAVMHHHRPLVWYSMRRSTNYSLRQDKTRRMQVGYSHKSRFWSNSWLSKWTCEVTKTVTDDHAVKIAQSATHQRMFVCDGLQHGRIRRREENRKEFNYTQW